MEELIGKTVLLFGGTFYFSGEVRRVTADMIWLGPDALIVFETGPLANAPDWQTAERIRKEGDNRLVGIARVSIGAAWEV